MARSLVAAVALALAACAGPSDPEQELRDLVDAAAQAAEERDTGFFRGIIAAGYQDTRGNDRAQLINFLRGYFLTHQDVQIVARVAEVELAGADAARVVVQAGMAGRRATESRFGLDADLYVIELQLAGGAGNWQVIGASWERALGE